MLTALSLALVATVTYDEPMAPVAVVLERIAKATNLKIEQQGIGNIPILVSAKDADPKGLLQQIANATDCELSSMQGGFRLIRTKAQAQKALDAEVQELAKRLQSAIEKRKDEYATSMDWSDSAVRTKAERLSNKIEGLVKEFHDEGDRTQYLDVMVGDTLDVPASLLMAKLMTSLPASTWVTNPGGILRLSDQPNQFQRKLNVNLAQTYGQFTEAHNRIRLAATSKIGNKEINYGFENRNLAPEDVARTVVLANWVYPGWVGIGVYAVDSQGNVVGRTGSSFGLPQTAPPDVEGISGDDVIELPSAAQTFAKALMAQEPPPSRNTMQMQYDDVMVSLGDTQKMAKQPEAVLDRICSGVDPFEDVAGFSLRKIAAAKNQNLVAVFPTDLYDRLNQLGAKGKFKFADFGRILKNDDIQARAADGWLVVRPRLAVNIQRNIVNRAALLKLCKALRAQGYARVDQLAEYAKSRSDNLDRGAMDEAWISVLNPAEATTLEQQIEGLRFYASLPAAIKAQADFKTPISGPLLPIVAQRLETFIGGSQVIGNGTAISSSDQKQNQWVGRYDVSEPLAAGLIRLEFTQKSETTLFAQRNSESGGRFLTANQIGVYRLMSKKPHYAEYQSELMPYDTYQQASSTEIRLNLWWGIPGQGGDSNNGATFDRLQDHVVAPEAGRWTWATLPSALKDQINAAEEKYKDRIGD